MFTTYYSDTKTIPWEQGVFVQYDILVTKGISRPLHLPLSHFTDTVILRGFLDLYLPVIYKLE